MVLRTLIATLLLMGLTIGFIYWGLTPNENADSSLEKPASEAVDAPQIIPEAAINTEIITAPSAVEPEAIIALPETIIEPAEDTAALAADKAEVKKIDLAKAAADKAEKEARLKSEAAKKKAQKLRAKKAAAKRKAAEKAKAAKAAAQQAEAEVEKTLETNETIGAPAAPDWDFDLNDKASVLKLFRQGAAEARTEQSAAKRDEAYLRLVDYAAANEIYGPAKSVISKISTASLRDVARARLAETLARKGRPAQAKKLLAQLENQDEASDLKVIIETVDVDAGVQNIPRK